MKKLLLAMLIPTVTACANVGYPVYECPEEVTDADVARLTAQYPVLDVSHPDLYKACERLPSNDSILTGCWDGINIYLLDTLTAEREATLEHEVCHAKLHENGVWGIVNAGHMGWRNAYGI